MIRIVLADDHAVIRSGLRALLERETDFNIAGEAADGRELVKLVEALQPDVVVTDIGMPNLDGIDAAQQITAKNKTVGVIILSLHAEYGYVLRALKAGAKGYLLKDSAEADLITAIHAVDQGKTFFSPAIGRLLLENYGRHLRRQGREDSPDRRSPREREILAFLADGKSHQDIAEMLNLGADPAETHQGD